MTNMCDKCIGSLSIFKYVIAIHMYSIYDNYSLISNIYGKYLECNCVSTIDPQWRSATYVADRNFENWINVNDLSL